MRILALGDVVGENTVSYLEKKLGLFKKENKIDFTVINGENAASGNGIERAGADRLFLAGADVITGGNHIWNGRDTSDLLNENANVIRPLNYPGDAPGEGYCVFDAFFAKIKVINLIGTAFMDSYESPFYAADKILSQDDGEDISIIDFHAEATAEKRALALYLAEKYERLAVFFGTHTHVQTADETILQNGVGYITDIGMSGPCDSVLGMDKERAIRRFMTKRPVSYRVAEGDISCDGVIFDVDVKTAATQNIIRVKI
ncbi:MAG: YmdB family metallophosphoesterase [Clostridia bacterium]|nr:YmdB family metallophosphoesterase [Clostridia bacterium]